MDFLAVRIEEAFLAQQKAIREGLNGLPTADQYLRGLVTTFERPLTYNEIDYLIREMVLLLVNMQDSPKILYQPAFDRFCQFIDQHCNIEMIFIAFMRIENFKVLTLPTKHYNILQDKIEEFRV